MIPGGSESVGRVPVGHGSNKFKREALDEVVLRVIDAIRRCADACDACDTSYPSYPARFPDR